MSETNQSMADPQQLRAWVFESLRQTLPPNVAQLCSVQSYVLNKAQQAGSVPQVSPISAVTAVPAWLADKVREVIWDLVIQGIVVPGVDTHQASLPFFKITDWGKKCLEKGEYLPHDAGLYLARLKKEIPEIDQIVVLYVRESLNCFRSGSYLASVTMLGVASERVLLVLRDSVSAALDSEEKKKKFFTDTERKPIKRVSDAIERKLDPVREQMPNDLGESIDNLLSGIFRLIRATRNDTGHPTGRAIDREEAFALLHLFPPFAKTVNSLIEWLGGNRI